MSDGIYEAIQVLQNIASIRRKKRLINGAINFNKQEVRFDLDSQNNPTAVLIKESKEAKSL